MKEILSNWLSLPSVAWLAGFIVAGTQAQTEFPANWRYQQALDVPAVGVVRTELSLETMDTCRLSWEDLRLADPQGREIPFLTIESTGERASSIAPKKFEATLSRSSTTVHIETGTDLPLDAVYLTTPASRFMKGARLEATRDGSRWTRLAEGVPLFRQPGGVEQLRLSLDRVPWQAIRIVVEDQRADPIPFTGARLETVVREPETVLMEAKVVDRAETLGRTRLTVNLPAANLRLTGLELDVTTPLYARLTRVAVPKTVDNITTESALGERTLYRMAVEGREAVASQRVDLDAAVPGRELIVMIENQDSPPLDLRKVRVIVRPIRLAFHATAAGKYQLYSGNDLCPAGRYDLALHEQNLKSGDAVQPNWSARVENPGFRLPQVLVGVGELAAALDPAGWKFRRPLQVATVGVQQMELDLDTLAHAGSDLADLRVLLGTNQVPILVERTSIQRKYETTASILPDKKRPTQTRWQIKLPQTRLPFHLLGCSSPTPLFERQVKVYEVLVDQRGTEHERMLASATWVRTPEVQPKQFLVGLPGLLESSSLYLETDNGDNQPIVLEKFELYYPATRIVFRCSAPGTLHLYYGNSEAASPRYDLRLVSRQLLTAPRQTATLGPEEQLIKGRWTDRFGGGRQPGVLLWGVLIGVTAVLVAVVLRLLKKPAEEPHS